MKYRFLTILVIACSLSACSTKQFIIASSPKRPDKNLDFRIVRNDQSLIIPIGKHPGYKGINNFVVGTKPAVARIDSLIYEELTKKGLKASIVNPETPYQTGFNYIRYQDYWSWDFKKYMPVLKIFLYASDRNEKIIEVASQGNKMGLHDYPNPQKQVPGLIEMLITYE